MRKIIVITMLSLDGIIQAPGGPDEDLSNGFTYGGWTVPYVDEFGGKVIGEEMSKPAEFLLGRKTFEIFAGYWPQHVEGWPAINKATKYVASTTLTKHEWNKSVFLKDNVVDEIKKLKEEEGPNLQVWGSGNFIQTLLKHDLVDEFWLKIFPVVLGKGKRLFADGTIPTGYQLIESKTSPSGVIFGSYKRAGEVKTGSF